MKHMSVWLLLVLYVVTLGIYPLFWLVQNKTRMNKMGAQIPSAWFMIIPFVNIWWTYKFSQGVEHVAPARMSTTRVFLLLLILGSFGILFIQHVFNKIAQPTG